MRQLVLHDKAGRYAASLRRRMVTHQHRHALFYCDNPSEAHFHRDYYMSIYRKLKGPSADNLHEFPRQRALRRPLMPASEIEWRVRRKAKPCETLLATTATWFESLPYAVRPQALRECFPRILNGLAAGWHDRDATLRYFDDLLTDRRGGRRGFPLEMLEELRTLKVFYEGLVPRPDNVWRRDADE